MPHYELLKPGLFARVRLTTSASHKAMLVVNDKNRSVAPKKVKDEK